MTTPESSAPLRILVVDDKRRVAQILGILLEEEGFEVVRETDPREALRIAREERIDLVLCDIVMPEMSGYEFCSALRKHPLTGAIPLLFVSSQEEREAALTGAVVGARGYVQKPFDRDDLLAEIRKVLA